MRWFLAGWGTTVVIAAGMLWHAQRRAPIMNDPRRRTAPGECLCGREVTGADHHQVTEVATDDDFLAGAPAMGGTAMVADFCPAHCPGGCDKGCPILRVVA